MYLAMTSQPIEFRARKAGIRPLVRCNALGVTYEMRHANWVTWLLVIFTGGLALFAWPWIQFGVRSVTIPRAMITSVEVEKGVNVATLAVSSTTARVAFKTDITTAEAAQRALLAQ